MIAPRAGFGKHGPAYMPNPGLSFFLQIWYAMLRRRSSYQKKPEQDIRCPLEYGLSVFGGKWKSRILCVLAAQETLRYSQLRKEMVNITDAVLATTLKELIADGMIARRSYDEIPPRVEYTLTDKGRSAVPILQSICAWSGAFYKDDSAHTMTQCQRCDHR